MIYFEWYDKNFKGSSIICSRNFNIVMNNFVTKNYPETIFEFDGVPKFDFEV